MYSIWLTMGLTSYIHFMNIKDFSHLSLESKSNNKEKEKFNYRFKIINLYVWKSIKNKKIHNSLEYSPTLLQESIISTPISLNASGITFFSKLYLIFPFFLSICTIQNIYIYMCVCNIII